MCVRLISDQLSRDTALFLNDFHNLRSILVAVFVFPLIFVQFPTSTISVKEHLYKFDIFYNFQIKFGPAIKRGCLLFCV